MKKVFTALLSLVMITLSLSTAVNAKTMNYESEDMTFDIPDSAFVITKETPMYDEAWMKAGITNIKDKLKELDEKEITATFYDSETKASVNYMVKYNEDTIEVFDLLTKSDAELQEYMDYLKNSTYESIISIPNPEFYDVEASDRKISISVDKYEHKQTPFYRMKISIDDVGAEAREVIYGTFINGKSIYFDMYKEGTVEIDETLARYIVDSINFSKIITAQEYDEMATSAKIRLTIILVIIVLIIVALILVFRRRKKATKNCSKEIAAYMREFREKKAQNKLDTTIKYTNETVYDEEVTGVFSLYHIWIKDIVKYSVGGLLIAASLIYLISEESYVYSIVIAVLTIAYAYLKSVGIEKLKKVLDTRFETKKKKTAVIRFYDEYFTVSGISSISEYCYKQITAAKLYKGYIFLYTGSEYAIYVSQEGFEEGKLEDFKKFIQERIYKKQGAK